MVVTDMACINGLTIKQLTPRTKEFLWGYCPSPRTAYENQPRQVGDRVYIPTLSTIPTRDEVEEFKKKRAFSDELKNYSPRLSP